MVLPIYTYGSKILREVTEEVPGIDDSVRELLADMFETMRGAEGIGLAAPQVGRTERIFIVDLTPLALDLEEDGEVIPEQPMVFINPKITKHSDVDSEFEEGCLSIPDIRENVYRPDAIAIEYRDEHFAEQKLQASGMLARVIQHEYDHLDGILFVDHLSTFRRNLLRRRLREMTQGLVEADYPLAT